MEFRILGPLEVIDGERPVALPKGRARALLGFLILHAAEVLSTDRLIDALWGETPPKTAITVLQGLVLNLRRSLEPKRAGGAPASMLETRSRGYVLSIDPQQVDANRFRRLVREAAAVSGSIDKATTLREALSLWRGSALSDVAYEPFAQSEIVALNELRLAALEARIDADLVLGRHGEVVGELAGLITEHPMRERMRAQLMLALYRSGRQAEALDAYREARRVLVEELGIEPAPELQRLEHAILRQDPSLDFSRAPSPAGPASVPQTAPPPGPPSWLPQARKTVTMMFVDLVESTSLGERLDPEALRRIVGRYFETAAGVIARHGGTVEKFIGDAVMAVFGVPLAHEDDALRAVRTAAELRHALSPLNDELDRDWGVRLAIRAGINTGEVVVGDPALSQTMVTGDPVNVAARLQQAAGEDEILIGESTRRLVRDAALLERIEPIAARGKTKPVVAWRLQALIPGAPTFARQLEAPMIGRETELAQLRAAFEQTVRDRRPYLCTVVGDPGIGKSKLGLELADALVAQATFLTGHCPPYGDGITFWPLREIVLQAAGGAGKDALVRLLADEDKAESIAEQVASAIGRTDPTGGPELFLSIRLFFEALAKQKPVVVALEDIHWAQPTFLDLIEYLAGWTRERVLLLCLSRHDLLESRPMWGDGKDNAALLSLEPLEPEEAEKLIADRLAGKTIPPETLDRILEVGGGNPLFVEQMLAALEEEADREEVLIPPTVQALLASRLDRLGPAERELVQCAAVVGADFSLEALVALLAAEARPSASRHLEILMHKKLIRPSRVPLLGKEAFSFDHVLIQEAAYRATTRQTRTELHERFAEWLEREAQEQATEFEEVVGYHLEQAYLQRRELGHLDEHGRQLATRAGERLARGGLRASARVDGAAAENLLSRARSLLAPGHPRRHEVTMRLAEADQMLGRHADADAVLAEALENLQIGGDRRVEQLIPLERARIQLTIGPDPVSVVVIRDQAERALEVLGEQDDEAGLALAWYVVGLVHMRWADLRSMTEAAEQALAHAERSNHPREELAARWMLAWAHIEGATPVPECIRRCEELMRWRGMEHPGVLSELGGLRAMLGQFEEAREVVDRGRSNVVERFRLKRPLMFVAKASATVETLAGDLSAGERELRSALDIARAMEERDQVSQIAAGLSRTLSLQTQRDEADAFASESQRTAPAEGVQAQALWRAARARVLSGGGRHDEAEQLAGEALDLVQRTDMLNLRGDLLLDLGDILAAAGDHDRGAAVLGDALDVYLRKGNIAAAGLARSRIT